MSNELLTLLEYVEQQRGITRESLIRALENAILTASRKSIHPASNLTVKIDPATGKIRAWAQLEVVDSIPSPDQIVIDHAREQFPEVKVGDTVTIFGEDPTISELASILGTIPYEILTSVPRRIERVVIGA